MHRFLLSCTVLATALWLINPAVSRAEEKESPSAVVKTYQEIVHATYRDAWQTAEKLQSAVDALIANPSEKTLQAARQAWIESRIPYGKTEVFRYYEGPIDRAGTDTREAGPEPRINAWPLNEAYIDYVDGNPKAGLVQNLSQPITMATLKATNQQKDEADVSTGYHAIEFLLWGQDFSKDGPGNRPYTDYVQNNPVNERRAEYLSTVTDLLVRDLHSLVKAWEPDSNNYAKTFLALSEKEALGKILTGAASLSGTEMAGERMNNSLISGDQEDEQSCFSDTTPNDFLANLDGIANVYFGQYGKLQGTGISQKLAAVNPELDGEIRAKLKEVRTLIEAIDTPYDQVLASEEGSAARKEVKAAVTAQHELASLLEQAGKVLGANVVIVSE
jgi:putative iron-regulated protein